MRRLQVCAVFLLILGLATSAAAGTWPHERDGFVLGFGVGGGSATYKPDVGESDDGGGGVGTFRLGWAFANQFLVGLEQAAWVGNTDLDATLTLSSSKLNFTWYPAAKGWFLRAGFGAGSGKVETDIGGVTVSASDNGGSVGFGGGHEWRLTRKFGLGAAVDWNTIDLDEEKFDFLGFTAQFNWYF